MKKLLAALLLLAPLQAHAQTVRFDLTDTAFTDAGPVSAAAPLSVSSYNANEHYSSGATYYDDNRFCYTVAASLPAPTAECSVYGGGKKGNEGIVVTSTGNLYLRAIGSGAAVDVIAVGALGSGGAAPALPPGAATQADQQAQSTKLDTIISELNTPPLPPNAATESKQDVGNTSLNTLVARATADPATGARQTTGNASLAAIATNKATLTEQQNQTVWLQNTYSAISGPQGKNMQSSADPAPGNYQLTGGTYQDNPPVLTDMQGTSFQQDQRGNLKSAPQGTYTGAPLTLSPGDLAPDQITQTGAKIVSLSSEALPGMPNTTLIGIQGEPNGIPVLVQPNAPFPLSVDAATQTDQAAQIAIGQTQQASLDLLTADPATGAKQTTGNSHLSGIVSNSSKPPVGYPNAAQTKPSVSTAAVQIVAARIGAQGTGRGSLMIKNNGPAVVYIAYTNAVTVANGDPLAVGASFTMPIQGEVWAISAAAGNTVSVHEAW